MIDRDGWQNSRRAAAPAGGLAAVGRAVEHFFSGGPPVGSGDPRSLKPMDVTQPLPVFALGLDDLQEAGGFDRARPVAWRYMVGHGEPVAVVDVRERAGQAVFHRMLRGEPVAGLMRAAHQLAALGDSGALEDVEVRVLDVPALHKVALWRHAANGDVFVPIADAGEVSHAVDGATFLRDLRDAARTAVRSADLGGMMEPAE
jgi:hypothetical protein